jgi:hypothetical protein
MSGMWRRTGLVRQLCLVKTTSIVQSTDLNLGWKLGDTLSGFQSKLEHDQHFIQGR